MKNVARISLAMVFALALAVGIAVAQDAKVAGKWETSMTTPNGETRTTTYTFEVKGETLSGTVSGGRGGDAPLSGTVKGKEITFTVKRMMRDQEITIEYKGTVNGDEIKGTMTTPQGSRDWTAKRAAAK